MPHKLSRFSIKKVRQRAKSHCEYCRSNERWQLIPFTIDHIIPISKQGTSELENLALACFHCNRHKSNIEFVRNVPIFNPRRMTWTDHFSWSEDLLLILPKTETGRVTIELLKLNRPRILQIRKDDIVMNRRPLQDDQ